MFNINYKKILIIFIIILFGICFSFTVKAKVPTETHDITIIGAGPNHVYQIYQIFQGTIKMETSQIGDSRWGTGVQPLMVLAALKSSDYVISERITGADGETSELTGRQVTIGEVFAECEDANDVSLAMSPYEDDSEAAREFAQIIGKYLSKTYVTAERGADGKYHANGLLSGYYLVKDAGPVEYDAQTRYMLNLNMNQEVNIKGDAPTMEKRVNHDGNIVEAADFQIGDVIEFKLNGTLPNKDVFESYSQYKYIFHDSLPIMLQFSGTASKKWKVEVYNGNNFVSDITSYFKYEAKERTFTIGCDNLRAISSLSQTITSLGSTDNLRIVLSYYATLTSIDITDVVYKNQNNSYLEFSDNPNQGGEGSTNVTPEDKATVYTYNIGIVKLNGKDQSIRLKDVGFKLYRERDGQKIWAIVEDNKVLGWTPNENEGTEMFTSLRGEIYIFGLDAATYVLVETTTPDGFNTMKDMHFTISSVIGNTETDQNVKSLQLTIDSEDGQSQNGDPATGEIRATVLNYPGGIFPATGALGTAMFYIIGGVLVVSSVILIFTFIRKKLKIE